MQSLPAILSDPAVQWASTHFKVTGAEIVRDSPWACTFELKGQEGKAYLKVLPKNHAQVVSFMPELAAKFPGLVPPVIANDSSESTLLLGDHGGPACEGQDRFGSRR